MHESKQMLRRVLEAGASGYVLKADFPHSLGEAVKNISRDKRFFSAKATEIVFNGFLETPDAPPQTSPTEPSDRKPTPRDTQIIRLLAAGKSNTEIAMQLGV